MHRSVTSLVPLALLFVSCSALETEDGQSISGGPLGSAWADRLTEPVTQVATFESPMIHTSARPFVMHHEFPATGIFGGGDLQLYGAQLRYAVNERLAIIATKDGYIDFNPGTGGDDTGFADIAAGFKYAVIDDPDAGLIVTPGLVFETDSGDRDVFQGNGDGTLRPFVAAGWDFTHWDVVGNLGFDIPLDDEAESTSVDAHVMFAYGATPEFFPLLEVNAIHWFDDGDTLPVDFEGGDLINLGSTDVGGNTVVSGALGFRYKFNERFLFGAAYEWPWTSREDILEDRITVDLFIFF